MTRQHFFTLFSLFLIASFFLLKKEPAYGASVSTADVVKNSFSWDSSSGDPIEITADGSSTFNDGIATAKKNVQIYYHGTSIFCDEADYYTDTHNILLKGDVRIYNQQGLFTGEKALYNVETEQTSGLDFGGTSFPFQFKSLSLKSPDLKEFQVRDALMTTSDSSEPTWSVRSQGMRIYDQDRVIYTNTTLYAGDTPVMWLPYFYNSLKETGFNIQPGYDSLWGGYVLGSYSYPLLSNENLVGKLHTDYRSLRGFATGIDLEDKFGKNNRNQGNFISYYAWDTNPNINIAPGQPEVPNASPGSYTQRFRVSFGQKLYLTDHTYASADLTKLSDASMMQTYYPAENRINPQPDSNIGLTSLGNDDELSLVTRWQMSSFQERTERLPEIALDFKQQRIFDTPLYYDGSTAIGQMQRNFAATDSEIYPDYTSPQDYNATRFDTFHQLSLPKTLFGWLSVVPKIGFRGTYYSHSGGYLTNTGASTTFPYMLGNNDSNFSSNNLDWQGSTFRSIFNTGIETSFKLARSFERVQSRFLGLDGLRHVLQPYSNLSYVHNGGNTPNQIFQFDRFIPNNPNNVTSSGFQPGFTPLQPLNFPQFGAIDSIADWTIFRLGMRNRLETRRDDTTCDWLDVDTFIDINGNDPYRNGNLSNLVNELIFDPVSWLSLHMGSQIPMNPAGFTEFNMMFDFMPARWLQFAVGNAYISNYNGLSGNQPSLNLHWQLNDQWSLTAYHLYNLNNGTPTTPTTSGSSGLIDQRYLLNRDLSSWVLSIGAEVRNNQGTSTGNALTQYSGIVQLTLKDIPELLPPCQFNASAGNRGVNGGQPLNPGP